MDSALSLSLPCSSPDCKWFTLIFIHIEFCVSFFASSSSSSFDFLFLFFSSSVYSLCFVSFFMWFDLWCVCVCVCVESTWLFIHDQCQMQANELRLVAKARQGDIAPKTKMILAFFFCSSHIFNFDFCPRVCLVRDPPRLHDFYRDDGARNKCRVGDANRKKKKKKLTKNSN